MSGMLCGAIESNVKEEEPTLLNVVGRNYE